MFRALTIAVGVFAWYCLGQVGLHNFPIDQLRSALSAVVGLDATLLGFMVSAGALLYAVANTQLSTNLQKSGHFQSLVKDLFFAALFFFVAICLALATLFFPAAQSNSASTPPSLMYEATRVVLSWNIAALLLLIPVGVTMRQLLLSIHPENSKHIDFK